MCPFIIWEAQQVNYSTNIGTYTHTQIHTHTYFFFVTSQLNAQQK